MRHIPLFIIISILILGCLQIGTQQSSLLKDTNSTIQVSGEGTAAGRPDIAVVNLGIETEAKSAQEAYELNSKLSSRLIKVLNEMGIENKNIRTTSISLYPEYNYENEKPTIKGYKAYNSFEIKIDDIDYAGKVIDRSIEAGVNRINGIYFKLSDDRLKELREAALKRAVEDASIKANTIAETLGVSIGNPVRVSESYYYTPPVYTMRAEALRSSTPVEPGEFELRVSVTIEYTFTQP